jgi:hypothetical protein
MIKNNLYVKSLPGIHASSFECTRNIVGWKNVIISESGNKK